MTHDEQQIVLWGGGYFGDIKDKGKVVPVLN
jgi:hypothetical protein